MVASLHKAGPHWPRTSAITGSMVAQLDGAVRSGE
jgi:hypothetical protein